MSYDIRGDVGCQGTDPPGRESGTGSTALRARSGAPYSPQWVSFAQNGEDIVLLRAFADQPPGFYVDVGAGHPVVGSVTKNLHDVLGWSGVDVEPLSSLADLISAARTRSKVYGVAVSSKTGPGVLYEFVDDWATSTTDCATAEAHLAMGRHATVTEVPTRTLEQVLVASSVPRRFELLKIDVEGSEADVLSSFDIEAWLPKVVVVEAIDPVRRARSEEPWERILLSCGYSLTLFDGINRFYTSREVVPRLRESLSIPANITDRFVPLRWWRCLSPWEREALQYSEEVTKSLLNDQG